MEDPANMFSANRKQRLQSHCLLFFGSQPAKTVTVFPGDRVQLGPNKSGGDKTTVLISLRIGFQLFGFRLAHKVFLICVIDCDTPIPATTRRQSKMKKDLRSSFWTGEQTEKSHRLDARALRARLLPQMRFTSLMPSGAIFGPALWAEPLLQYHLFSCVFLRGPAGGIGLRRVPPNCT